VKPLLIYQPLDSGGLEMIRATLETQLARLDEEMQHCWGRLTGPDESMRRRLVEARDGLNDWKEIRLTPTGTLTVHLEGGSTR